MAIYYINYNTITFTDDNRNWIYFVFKKTNTIM